MMRVITISIFILLIFAGTAVGEISRDGLVAEWHFDGDAKDSSGNGNDGVIYGATFVDGIGGKALSFDGVDDYVQLPFDSGPLKEKFTIAAFVYPSKSNTQSYFQGIVHNDNYPNRGMGLSVGAYNFSVMCYFHNSDGVQFYIKKSTTQNEWHYYVCVYDGTYLNLYEDGILVESVKANGIIKDNDLNFQVGHDLYDESRTKERYFGGKIDEVAIYNRALSENEIKILYETIISNPDVPIDIIAQSTTTPKDSNLLVAEKDETPTQASSSISPKYLYGGAGLALILLLFVAMIRRKPKEHATSVKATTQRTVPKQPEPKPIIQQAPIRTKKIEVKTAFGYKGATIQYKIKIENPTSEPVGDVKISLYVPDVFLISESTKNIPMLKPGESKTATFEIRPTGECGDCEVSGRVVYYDYSVKKTSELDITARSLSIVCPMLHSKEISNAELRSKLSNLAKAEESTKEIDMPSETLFNISTRILRDMNMYMLEPEITSTPQLYNAVARFYAEGVKDLKYAVQIEVVGGAKKSKLILKVWAENEESLTGFYHGILDEIEKRIKVKDYINDSIVQQNIHIGDKIGTQVKDSVVQRSNIGVGERKCPNCGREVESNEKFCLECGAKL